MNQEQMGLGPRLVLSRRDLKTPGDNVRKNGSYEWPAQSAILVYGVRIGLRTNRPEALERLAERFPPLWKAAASPVVDRMFSLRIERSTHALFENGDLAVRSRRPRVVFESFETRLKIYVAEMARRRVFVHAGVVGWRGKAILIPGRSMSGKTSLVKELVCAGATYYSDEYAVLDSQGRAHPYPQPLALRDRRSFKQKNRPVEDFGGVVGTRPLPVGMVIVSRYKPGARWRPGALSAGQAVLELLANTVPARRKPEVVIPTLQQAVREATVLKGARGEADAVVRLLLRG
jgi:hypothetical protein